jgi:16S rRNA (cytosine967-C5)-methyltransferase
MIFVFGKLILHPNEIRLTASFKNIEAITKIAGEIMLNGSFADKAFEFYFRNNKSLTDTETSFIVEEVYNLVRNWRLYSEIQARLCKTGYPDQVLLLLGIGWTLTKRKLPDWEIFKPLKQNLVLKIYSEIIENKAISLSIPDWLYETGERELGNQWINILEALNQPSKQVIRVNTIKVTKEKLQQTLLAGKIITQAYIKAPDALIFNNKLNLFKLPGFKHGLFEMQDISSQMVGHFAGPLPGMRVVDGCAGNGGKTLHLASLMQNKGRIIALDIFAGKLDTLRCRASRAGISIIETRVIDTTKVIKRLYNSADLVLLDVPCSGLGVLKRNPEIKWRLQPTDLENLRKTQEEILNRYSLMVKPGGRLVYSTCSILPSENSDQVRKFLEKHSDEFSFVDDKFISPGDGFDGFYMAMLTRKPVSATVKQ